MLGLFVAAFDLVSLYKIVRVGVLTYVAIYERSHGKYDIFLG